MADKRRFFAPNATIYHMFLIRKNPYMVNNCFFERFFMVNVTRLRAYVPNSARTVLFRAMSDISA